MTNRALTTRNLSPMPFGDRDPFFTPFFERFFNLEPYRTDLAPFSGEELTTRNWMPAVDVKETPEAFMIHAELPGLTKEDIHITMEDNVLRLSGERKFEKKEEKDNYHRIERAYGAFSRSFTLGTGVLADKVKAEFKDGMLMITVPKAEEVKPRRIQVA
ncbi:MAG TPA: Hsp20/alpha crystallin family protein [Thermoanaerobaculia bacterium]|nr:Hsp20/alpha crystallin family protein [Thermoanaerobaculia bacterium]